MESVGWKTRLWHRWKSLRSVPFRRSWFVGYDLHGNSYWELKDYNNPFRLRRKVEPGRPMHIGEYKAAPQWMQWLRHTRPTPPSWQEQISDQQRQVRIKYLAQQAEERWRTVPLKGNDNDADPRLTSAWNPGQKPKEEPEYSFTGNFTNDPISARMYSAANQIKQKEEAEKRKRSA